MKRQLQGIALILFSLLLSVSFEFMGIKSVFDLSISWQPIFLIVAIIGMVLVFVKAKDEQYSCNRDI